MTSAESVASAAKWIEEEYGVLDVLVNNAGILIGHEDSVPSATSVDTLRATYETNVFGVVAVTNAMLPLLRRSAAARIVNLSSGLASLTRLTDPDDEFWAINYAAYNSSKTALNMITVSYAKELAGTPIKVNAADPGYCATDINGHSGPREAAQERRSPYGWRCSAPPPDGRPPGRRRRRPLVIYVSRRLEGRSQEREGREPIERTV
nr:hypothetical protein GCM10020093_035340 [Planobispora longispora]